MYRTDEKQTDKPWQKSESEQRRGRLYGGVFVVIVGALYLLRELGYWLPNWLFTWQMLLIAIGVFIGLKHSFRNFGWLIMILIGTTFLLKDYAPWLHINNFLWPIAIIILGLFMIFKPRRESCSGKMKWHKYRSHPDAPGKVGFDDDEIDFNAVFGGIRKNIITKNFRGGEINAVFGGAEVNFMQADFTGAVELEVNSVFGGTRLIIPSNWTIKSEVAAVMGSVEDKRPITKEITVDPNKTLILRGNAVFGGIEIQSYS